MYSAVKYARKSSGKSGSWLKMGYEPAYSNAEGYPVDGALVEIRDRGYVQLPFSTFIICARCSRLTKAA